MKGISLSDAFDEEEFMDSIEGDLEFLEEAVATFDEDTPALIARIGQAVEAGDANALITPAHAMKGLLATGLPARDAGERVLQALRDERFYILTHPDWPSMVEARMRAIVDGDDPARPPPPLG